LFQNPNIIISLGSADVSANVIFQTYTMIRPRVYWFRL